MGGHGHERGLRQAVAHGEGSASSSATPSSSKTAYQGRQSPELAPPPRQPIPQGRASRNGNNNNTNPRRNPDAVVRRGATAGSRHNQASQGSDRSVIKRAGKA